MSEIKSDPVPEIPKKNDNKILFAIIIGLLILMILMNVMRTADMRSAEQYGYFNCMNEIYNHFNTTLGG